MGLNSPLVRRQEGQRMFLSSYSSLAGGCCTIHLLHCRQRCDSFLYSKAGEEEEESQAGTDTDKKVDVTLPYP